mgnify:CR=1 FL=1
MKWEYKTLDQLGTVSRGKSKHRPRNDPKLFGGKYPFIQTADVKNADYYITKYSDTYNESGLAQSKLWDKGTLCITIAANIADTGVLAFPACFPDSIMGFVPFEGVANTRFIKYCFDRLQRDCKQISQGTAQDNLSWEKLSTIKFCIPEYKEQCRIADILSAYDDLIENNQKQIKLLEEAAQRLYKEWFVDLRFPGHENTEIVDGVPEGWEKNCAEKFFEITIGKTPPRTEKRCFTTGENGISWVSIADMGNSGMFVLNTAENLTEDAIKQYNVKVIPKNTVLLSFKLTVGRVAIASTDICTNEAIAHFKGRRECEREYTYCYLKNFHYDELGSTSSISKAVNSKIIKAMPFIMPSEKLLKEYSSKTKDIFDLIICKQKMDNNLKIARDRILHKLMSGEMEV